MLTHKFAGAFNYCVFVTLSVLRRVRLGPQQVHDRDGAFYVKSVLWVTYWRVFFIADTSKVRCKVK